MSSGFSTIYRRSGRYNAVIEPKIIRLDRAARFGVRDRRGRRHRHQADQLRRQRRISATAPCAAGSRPPKPPGRRFLSSDDRFRSHRLILDREAAAEILPVRRLRRLPGRLGRGRAGARPRRLLHHLHDQRGRALQVRQGRRQSALKGLDTDVLKSYLPIARASSTMTRRSRRTVRNDRRCRRVGLRLRRCPAPTRRTTNAHHGRHLRRARRPAGLCRAHRRRRQHPHTGQGDRRESGDAFSTAKVRRSQQRLKNLGFFEKVDI